MPPKNREERRAEARKSKVNDVRIQIQAEPGDIIQGLFHSAFIHKQQIGGDNERLDATLNFHLTVNNQTFEGSCKVRQVAGRRYYVENSVEVVSTTPVVPRALFDREKFTEAANGYMKHLVGPEAMGMRIDASSNTSIEDGTFDAFHFPFEYPVIGRALN